LRGFNQWKEQKYFCHRGRVAEFLKIVVYADNFGHVVDPLVKDFVN